MSFSVMNDMIEMKRNYHRFYALLGRVAAGADKDDVKESLVSSFTDGRTTSLKEMTQQEYNAMCVSLEERSGWRDELRRKRSVCLKLMLELGVDTSDWSRVNGFCRNPKIAGKAFAQLGIKDLDALQVKLRAIKRKGGFGARRRSDVCVVRLAEIDGLEN